jgi:hypothetical protein
MQNGTGSAVPALGYFPKSLSYAPYRYSECSCEGLSFVRVFTILDRLFGMALSTLHDWSSLRHQSQEDSQRPQIPVRETIPTKIYCKRANLRSSLFLMRRMLTPRRFQVFDFSVSRQLVGAAIGATRSTIRITQCHPWSTVSEAHDEKLLESSH